MFLRLVVTLIRSAMQRTLANKGVMIAVGGAAVADAVNLDWLRQEALKIAPGSDQAGLEEAARTAARLLGLGGDEVLWPKHTRGPQAGEPIIPAYLTVDLTNGRAWYSSRHYSRKSVNSAFRRGSRRGWGRGKGQGLRETQAYAKG